MSTVTLIQAQPRFAASGAVADVRLAGGGTKAYFQLGFGDWRSGIARPPRFSTAIGFDQRGLTGGALPTTGGFEFASSDKALFSALGGMVWEAARVTVTTGDDEDIFPDYAAQLVGTVAAVKTDKATLSFVIADLSIDLDKPVIVGTFSGSGALEGGDDAVGRPKRRSWGPVFGIEGRLLDKAYNVYEFGDPAYPIQAFKALKDKGRTGDMIVVPWQGSGLATLNALRAAQAPSGGGAVAPSIACAKWWTTPAGPLTADLEGEVGAGYVGSAVAIAARLALTYSAAIRIDDSSRATAETWPAGAAPAGVHCAETSESVANLLDRLLLPLSIIWILDGAGRMTFRRLTWANPVETLRADTIKREVVFKPLKVRRYGYQRNYRPHAEGEISAAIPADEILFPDGSTAADLADTVADLNRDLEAVVSDAVLSRVEKPIWIDRYDEIVAQQTALDAKYVALGSPPELNDAKNAATAFVNALKLYLDGLTPSWRDTKTDTAIVKDDFAGYWRNAIAAIAQYIAAITGRPGKDGRDGINGTNGTPGRDGTNGTAAYFHVAYANSANGADDFTTSDPGSRLYIGVLVDQTPADSEDYRVYTWSRLTGADGLNGTNGTPGPPGANGQTSYVHFAYANSADGSVDFSTDNPVGRAYLGAYSDFTLADSTDFRSYTWSLVKGADGRDGVNGKDGAPGRDGVNGGSAYFHVAYANSADGSTDFTTGAPGTRTYLGVAVDQSPTDPEDFRAYAWSLIKGKDGLNGSDGAPGPRGPNGQQSYVHFAYSNSADGSTDFSTDDPAGRIYIGVYSDFTLADSADYRSYVWSLVKGADVETYTAGARGNSAPAPTGYLHGLRRSDGFVFADSIDTTALRSDQYRRSYTVCYRASRDYWAVRHFDVWGAGEQRYPDDQGGTAAGVAAYLNGLPAGLPVVVFTGDEPQQRRKEGGLPDALYRCGASAAFVDDSKLRRRGAYVLIGVAGWGQGRGFEYFAGSTDDAADAIVQTNFSIVNGVPSAATAGTKGNDGFSLIASPAAFVVPSFANGTSKPAWTGGSCRIALIKGGAEVAADVYSYADVSNISSIAMSGQSITFGDVIGDKGEFTARATRGGTAYNIRVTVVRAKDGSAAFTSSTPFSGTSGSASAFANTTVPGGKTVRVSGNANYAAPNNQEGQGTLALYWRNVTDNGPRNFLGEVTGSVASKYNQGSPTDPEYNNITGSVSTSYTFTSPSPDKNIEYSAEFRTSYGVLANVDGRVGMEATE